MDEGGGRLGIALLSGAGLHPWIWDDVVRALDVPCVAVRFRTERSQLGLADYTAAAVEQIEAAGFRRVLVVAHSIGGVVGLGVASVLGERVVGVLGVAAAFPAPGTSFLASLPLPQRLVLPLAIRVAGTRPPPKAIRSGLCSDLDARIADRIVEGFTPESKALYSARVPRTTMPDVRGYLTTTRDKEFSMSLQARYARRLSGGGLDATVEAGHLPMLSEPGRTVQVIDGCLQALSAP